MMIIIVMNIISTNAVASWPQAMARVNSFGQSLERIAICDMSSVYTIHKYSGRLDLWNDTKAPALPFEWLFTILIPNLWV